MPSLQPFGPGESNSVLPVVHELLEPPQVDGDRATASVCVHSDWVVRPEGEPPAWIQSLNDDETSGTMSFRRIVGRWRLQDRELTPDTDPGRCVGRCGPDPKGTAHRHERYQPNGRDDDGDGVEDWATAPTPTDPPCPS